MPRTLLTLCILALPLRAQWGRDINEGAGTQLIETVSPDLAALLRAPPGERPARIEAIVRNHGVERIEALKRFRNPEFRELFLALLEMEDWTVRHRALFALDYYRDAGVVERAWPLLRHPNRRLREKAAITCLKLWAGGTAPGDVDELLAREHDPHVRHCLEALQARIAGRLEVERVYEEHLETAPGGLRITPFLSGLNNAGSVAPGWKGRPVARTGKAGKARTADRWTTPLLGYGEEEVAGTTLQPFANLRQDGTVYHTGQDVGASMDGAGYYAVADGVVRLIHSGGDMGTLIVVEHKLPDGELVNAVYMHGGDTVFVKAGDRVACGQLLGTMGMGYSLENGGHFAHLHFGLYPGPFDMAHNYGYKPVARGLADWHDPAVFLPRWIERTAPLVAGLRPVGRAFDRIVARIGKGELGRAYTEAVAVRDANEPGGEVYVDAMYLADTLKNAPAEALRRTRKLMEEGYPGDALEKAKAYAALCRGLPDAEQLEEARRAWQDDALVKKAVKGEKQFAATKARAAREDDPARVRALWEKLLKAYGDTCLAPRIQAQLR